MGLQPSERRRPEPGELTGDRLQHNQSLPADRVMITAVYWGPSSLTQAIFSIQHCVCLPAVASFRLQTATKAQTNWQRTGVNHGLFESIAEPENASSIQIFPT